MSLSTSIHELKTLVLSCHPVIVMETVEEERARTLLLSLAVQLNRPLFEWSLTRGLTKAEEAAAVNRMTAEPSALVAHLKDLRGGIIALLKDFSPHLDNPVVARQFRELAAGFTKKHSTAVLTGETVHLPKDLEHVTVRCRLRLPGREELNEVINSMIRSVTKNPGPPQVKTRPRNPTPQSGPKVTPQVREEFLRALRGMTLNQARQAVAYALIEDGRLTSQDIKHVLDRKAQLIREGGLLEYYPSEDNQYELGGFSKLKGWLERATVGFSPQAEALNLHPPRGILLVGVPGCGKSLAAKAVARFWKLPLLKLDAGRLFDKYIGESEKNFRKAISLAESMAPAVFWIDEIEKGMVAGGSGEGDAGLSRRLFGAFLTWLQEKRQTVFVVATANNLSALPPELLRKGRFDEIFFVDLPNPEERKTILSIQLGLRKQEAQGFDLDKIASACEGFSGAEIEQAVVSGLYRALHLQQPLGTELLLEEISQTIPLSVTRREEISQLRETARRRFVSVS